MQKSKVTLTRFKRLFAGEITWWPVFVPIAVGLAALLFVAAGQTDEQIIHLVPEDFFDLAVFSLSLGLGFTIGYVRGGIFLTLFVVFSVWFGSAYYGSQQPGWDTPPPGAGIAVLVGVMAAIGYGLPSFVIGRILRALVNRYTRG